MKNKKKCLSKYVTVMEFSFLERLLLSNRMKFYASIQVSGTVIKNMEKGSAFILMDQNTEEIIDKRSSMGMVSLHGLPQIMVLSMFMQAIGKKEKLMAEENLRMDLEVF